MEADAAWLDEWDGSADFVRRTLIGREARRCARMVDAAVMQELTFAFLHDCAAAPVSVWFSSDFGVTVELHPGDQERIYL